MFLRRYGTKFTTDKLYYISAAEAIAEQVPRWQQPVTEADLSVYPDPSRCYNGGMTLKSETPKEVTLQKSPSGTWVAPEKIQFKVRPWQRLWFVTGVIYLLVLAGCCMVLMPDQMSIERRMVFSITEEVKRFEGMAFAGESPVKIFEAAGSQGYARWIAGLRTSYRIGPEGDAGFNRIEKEYRDAINALPKKRILCVIICFIAWVVPMSLLYAAGLVIDWIRKGAHVVKQL